jgi:hypothetical protein
VWLPTVGLPAFAMISPKIGVATGSLRGRQWVRAVGFANPEGLGDVRIVAADAVVLQEEQREVVLDGACLGVEPPEQLGQGLVELGQTEGCGQRRQVQEPAVAVAGLDEAVGEEQQPVAGLEAEGERNGRVCRDGEPERSGGSRELEQGDLLPPDEKGSRVAVAEQPDLTRVGHVGEHGRHEVLAAQPRVQLRVAVVADGREVVLVVGGLAEGRQGEGGGVDGVQALAPDVSDHQADPAVGLHHAEEVAADERVLRR